MHQLRLFAVLADELHFGRAARRVFLSQPALSQQIRALEERLGVDLIDRTSRRVDLTPAGRALAPVAREIVDGMQRLRGLADTLAREVTGHLRLGAIGAEAAMPYTVEILAELAARHPAVTVEVRGVDFVEQSAALAAGELDAAFLRSPVPATFRILPLATEPRVACLPATDPLAGKSPITLADLRDHPVVDVPPGAPREWWDDWAVNPRPDGSLVTFGPVVSDLEGMLLAVARGQAITFLPAAARDFFPRPGVAYVDVTDLPPSGACLAWLPGRQEQPALGALVEAARTVVARSS